MSMKVRDTPPTVREHLYDAIRNQSHRLTVNQLALVLECVDMLGKMDLKDFISPGQFTIHILPKEPEPDGNGEIPIY